MNRLALLAGVIVAAGAVLALWMIQSGRQGRAAEVAAPAVRMQRTFEGTMDVPQAPDPTAAQSVRQEIQSVPKTPREWQLASESLPKRFESTLRIVDVRTGERLPGAQVQWAPRGTIDGFRSQASGRWDASVDEILERVGRTNSADAQGVVRIPYPLLGMCLFSARHGQLSATASLMFSESGRVSSSTEEFFTYRADVELELFPDRALEIQVADSEGRPRAGVEVCLRLEGVPRKGEIWRGETRADDGIARIEHADHLLKDLYQSLRSGTPAQLVADLGFVTSPPLGRRVDPYSWPVEPIALELPGMGSLTVIVLGRNGEPTAERVKVYVDATDVGDAWSPRIGEGDLEHGRIRFGSIQYGLTLAVNVSFYGRRDSIRREILGPDVYQQDLELTLYESAPSPRVTARLLDGSGQPIADSPVSFRFVSRDGSGNALARGNHRVRTDVNGLLEMQLLTTLYPQGSCTIVFAHGDRYTERELTGELLLRNIELGDLRLDREQEEPPARAR